MNRNASAAAIAEARGLDLIQKALSNAGLEIDVQAELRREILAFRPKPVSPWAIEQAERRSQRARS